MNTLMKKLVASATVLMCGTMMLAPGMGSAMTEDELQASIDALLAQLADLQAQLDDTDGTTPAPTGGTIAGCEITSFDRNLKVGMTGDDVKCLQIVMNSASDTQLGTSGAGSPGNETSYFGPITKAGVIKFQEKYTEEVLSPYGLTSGTGFVGSTTRAQLNTILAAGDDGDDGEVKAPSEITNAVECVSAGYYWSPTGCHNGDGVVEEPDDPDEDTPAAEDVDNSSDCIGYGYFWGPNGCYSGTATGTGLTVALADDTAVAAVLADGTAYNNFLKLNLTAGSDGAVDVTGVKVTRGGISLNTDVSGVLVVDQNGERHGAVVTSLAADNTAAITFASDPITVPAGQTVPVSIQAHIPSGSSGTGTMYFKIAASSDITTTADISGAFAITGNTMSITDGANTVGSITIDAIQVHANGTTDATAVNVNLGTTDQELGKFRFTAGANEDVQVSKITLYNNGNTIDTDIANIDLIAPTGDVLATVVETSAKLAVFDLSASPYTIAKGTSKDLTIRVDIVSGSTRTVRFLIQNDYDVVAIGANTGSSLLATADATGTDRSIPIGDRAYNVTPANGVYMNKMTIQSGSLSVKKSLDSPSGNIAVGGQDIVLAMFELEAVGEDIEWRGVMPKITVPDDDFELIGTVKLVDSDGVVLWSLDATTDSLYYDTAGTLIARNLSTRKIISAGTKEIISAVGSISTSALTTYSYQISLKDFTTLRKNTNDYVTYASTYVDGNVLNVTTASLSVAKDAAFANPTRVKGAQGVKLAAFQLTAGAATGVRISAVKFDEGTDDNLIMSVDFDDLEVWSDVDNDGTFVKNGEKLALTSTNASESEQVTLTTYIVVPAGTTVPLELYGDVLTNATHSTAAIGIVASGVTATAITTGNTIASVPGNLIAAQTVTLNDSGTFTLALDTASNLKDNQITSGTTGLTLGAWKMVAADSEDIKVTSISFVNAGNNLNGLRNFKLYDEDNSLVATMAGSLVADGFVTFDLTSSPFIIDVSVDRSEVLTLKGDTVYTATTGQTAQFAMGKIVSKGVVSVKDIYPTNTTEDASSASDVAYAVGDVVALHDESHASTDPFNIFVVSTAVAATATAEGADILVDGYNLTEGTDADDNADDDHITKIDYISTESTATDVAINNYRIGDVVVIEDDTTNSTSENFVCVVSKNIAVGGSVDDAHEVCSDVTLNANSRITKIASGLSQAIKAGSLTAAIAYSKGDVIVVTELGETAGIFVVDEAVEIGASIDAADELVKGYTIGDADAYVAKLPILSTETVSDTCTYTYNIGDVIVLHDESATTDDGVFVVETAVAAGGDILGANLLVTGLTTAASDIVTRLATKTAESKERILYDTVLSFEWDSSFTASTSAGSQREIAKFKLTASDNQSNADVVVSIMNFTEGGSATLTNLTLRNETLTLDVATNETDTNFTGLTGNGVLIPAGTTYTYVVKADIGTNANNESSDFSFTSGSMITSGSITWKTQIESVDKSTNMTWVEHTPSTDTKQGVLITSASDSTAPTISSVGITGGVDNTNYDTEVMLITFSEKIDPSTISASLTYGGSITIVNNASTGGLSVTNNGATDTLNVKNIVNLEVGAAVAASGSTITVTCVLDATGTTLTITGTAGGLTGNGELAHAASTPLATTIDDVAGNKLGTTAVTAGGTW